MPGTGSPSPRAVLQAAIDDGQFPGCVAVHGDHHGRSEPIALGALSPGGPPVTPETRYDLASLTKVVATLPAVLRLLADGRVRRDDTVRDHISNAGWFQTPSLGDVTVGDLLTHTSGLPAWRPLYAQTSDRMTALAALLQTPVTPAYGLAPVYSDLGFLVLGALVERVTRLRLDRFVHAAVLAPLGMDHTGFRPLGPDTLPVDGPIAPTEDCGWRNEVLCGVVHAENAFRMDGVAGHAGLFGTAGDLARYAQAWMALDPRLGPTELLLDTCRPHAVGPGLRRGQGWLLRGEDSFAGDGASDTGHGHTGFTGTSLWVDREAGWWAVLLTNRVHPTRRHGAKMHAVRRAFHAAVSASSKTP